MQELSWMVLSAPVEPTQVKPAWVEQTQAELSQWEPSLVKPTRVESIEQILDLGGSDWLSNLLAYRIYYYLENFCTGPNKLECFS